MNRGGGSGTAIQALAAAGFGGVEIGVNFANPSAGITSLVNSITAANAYE